MFSAAHSPSILRSLAYLGPLTTPTLDFAGENHTLSPSNCCSGRLTKVKHSLRLTRAVTGQPCSSRSVLPKTHTSRLGDLILTIPLAQWSTDDDILRLFSAQATTGADFGWRLSIGQSWCWSRQQPAWPWTTIRLVATFLYTSA